MRIVLVSQITRKALWYIGENKASTIPRRIKQVICVCSCLYQLLPLHLPFELRLNAQHLSLYSRSEGNWWKVLCFCAIYFFFQRESKTIKLVRCLTECIVFSSSTGQEQNDRPTVMSLPGYQLKLGWWNNYLPLLQCRVQVYRELNINCTPLFFCNEANQSYTESSYSCH